MRFARGGHISAIFTKIMVEQLLKVTSKYEERLRVSLMYLFCEESNAIQFLRPRTILIILTLGFLVLFFYNLSPLRYHTNHPLVRLVGVIFFNNLSPLHYHINHP